jgi:hypothetical protein
MKQNFLVPDYKNGIFQRKTKSVFRDREKNLQVTFTMNGDISYCNSADELLRTLGHEHTPEDWRLFIDSSKLNLKAVLHNVNDLSSTPVAYAVSMKVSHENMKLMLSCVQYTKKFWNIFGDLKVIAGLLGM